jgi:hypothetical protein
MWKLKQMLKIMTRSVWMIAVMKIKAKKKEIEVY